MVSIVKIETITTQKIEKVVFVNAKTKQNRKWKHLNPTTFFRWKMDLKAIGIPQAWVVSKGIEGCSKTHDLMMTFTMINAEFNTKITTFQDTPLFQVIRKRKESESGGGISKIITGLFKTTNRQEGSQTNYPGTPYHSLQTLKRILTMDSSRSDHS